MFIIFTKNYFKLMREYEERYGNFSPALSEKTRVKKLNLKEHGMLTQFIKQSRSAIMLLLLLTLITGIIYPLLITGVGKLLFPKQSLQ